MRDIVLSGQIGKQFGRHYCLDVSSVAEAVRALQAVVPGFRVWLSRQAQAGAVYQVFVDGRDISEQELQHPAAKKIRIVPVMRGAKAQGAGQTILGAVLVAAGAVAQFGFGQPWGTYLMQVGAAMMLGGVAQMLSAQTPSAKASAKENDSLSFGGAVNTSAQGNPVPVAYGLVMAGSAVISAGYVTEDRSYVPDAPVGEAWHYTNDAPDLLHVSWLYPPYSSKVQIWLPVGEGYALHSEVVGLGADIDFTGQAMPASVRLIALNLNNQPGSAADIEVESRWYESPSNGGGDGGSDSPSGGDPNSEGNGGVDGSYDTGPGESPSP